MLAGDRAAIANHKLHRFIEKGAKGLDALGRLQIEIDASVYAALTEVTVEMALITVTIEERTQLAQISAELLGRHGRVFPTLP